MVMKKSVGVSGVNILKDVANILRRDVLSMTTVAGSGHPTSCLSCAEIMSVLFFNEMKYDVFNFFNRNNDEFILSKGHAAPILYSCLKHAGVQEIDDLMNLRKLSSNLEGHPMPRGDLKGFVKVATGSLGQGLSVGCGMALASKFSKRKNKVYVLMGDSEISEGSVYEALEFASYYELNNLVAIVDVNRLGQRGETMIGWKIDSYKKRFESFGWRVLVVDGHDVTDLIKNFSSLENSKTPTAILAKTYKGKGVSFLENKEGWHGKVLDEMELERALKEIPNPQLPKFVSLVHSPGKDTFKRGKRGRPALSKYVRGDEYATRQAYGKALASLSKVNDSILVLDAEVSNSTYADEVKKVRPKQFVEDFIMEQNMIGVALGLSKKGYDVFASTFSAFLTRAHDQIRMASLSKGDFTICGSHAGVSIGEDGASQMGLEDIAMFRSLNDSIVFYPSDAVSTEKIVFGCSSLKGLKYIRTTRGKTPVIYSSKEEFAVGDFKVLKQSAKDKVVLVGSGVTLFEALKAYDILKEKKTSVAVIDLYCVKPFDAKKFLDFVKKHGSKIVVAEDHRIEGGIGEMLASVVASDKEILIKSFGISELPHSGKGEELLEKYGIDFGGYVKETEKLLRG